MQTPAGGSSATPATSSPILGAKDNVDLSQGLYRAFTNFLTLHIFRGIFYPLKNPNAAPCRAGGDHKNGLALAVADDRHRGLLGPFRQPRQAGPRIPA